MAQAGGGVASAVAQGCAVVAGHDCPVGVVADQDCAVGCGGQDVGGAADAAGGGQAAGTAGGGAAAAEAGRPQAPHQPSGRTAAEPQFMQVIESPGDEE